MSLLANGRPDHTVRLELKPYLVDLRFTRLVRGSDNVHYDVSLSPRFVEFARKYIQDLLRQAEEFGRFYGTDAKPSRAPETGTFKKLLAELLQAALTRAKFEKNIEVDLLIRLAVMKYLIQEIGSQFSYLLLECKESLRRRGPYFEGSEEAHLKRAQLAEIQGQRRKIHRQVGLFLHQILVELEDTLLSKARRALFREDNSDVYEMLKNPLVFVEGGRDDFLLLDQYVLLGNYPRDQDRLEKFNDLLVDLLREILHQGDEGNEARQARAVCEDLARQSREARAELVRLEEERAALQKKLDGGGVVSQLLGRPDPARSQAALVQVERRCAELRRKLEALADEVKAAGQRAEYIAEQHNSQLDGYLSFPDNARQLFDAQSAEADPAVGRLRAYLLDEWVNRLERQDLIVHILASYELRNIHLDYCPPVHLQQLKKALVDREELKRVAEILGQFPGRGFSVKRIEDTARTLRRYRPEQVRAVARRFAEDFMRVRRDLRNAQRLAALMESIRLIADERTRELSRVNNTLYECVLRDEERPQEDRIVSHAVVKVDVRDSTRITQELLARNLNPASHFSLNLYEPVRRLLEQYGAAKVFIEGDAIILAIYEMESNQAHQRAVAKTCLLARDILRVAQAYTLRAQSSDLPPLTLGLGIAFQNSPPTFWMEGESRIMISKALNLSDRLSGCSKVARRLIGENPTPFNLFVFQTLIDEASDEGSEEFLIRYNMGGIELNHEGLEKLGEELALATFESDFRMPWGQERVSFYVGQVPVGDNLELIVLRKGIARQLLPGRAIGGPGTHVYYEVCTHPTVLELAESHLVTAVWAS